MTFLTKISSRLFEISLTDFFAQPQGFLIVKTIDKISFELLRDLKITQFHAVGRARPVCHI